MPRKKQMVTIPQEYSAGQGIDYMSNARRNNCQRKLYAGIEALMGKNLERVVRPDELRSAFPESAATILVSKLAMVSWLSVDTLKGPLYKLTIDRELKAICENRSPRPQLNGKSIMQFCADLRSEIKRRREAAHYRRARAHNQWCPDNVIKVEICQLIDWIENQLDQLETINPGQSANVQEGAVMPLNRAKGSENGTKDQFRTGSAHAGTSGEICEHATPSRGTESEVI